MTRLLLAVLLAAASARAEEYTRYLQPERDASRARSVVVALESTPAGPRPGGHGWITVDLENRHDESHTVGIDLASGIPVLPYRFRRSVELDPGARTRVFLPLPTGDSFARARLSLDGTPHDPDTRFHAGGPTNRASALYLGERPADGHRWMLHLEGTVHGRRGGRWSRLSHTTLQQRAARDLPDRWQLLTGFDLVLADGRDRDLGAVRQQLLERYVAAGGHVLVVHADALVEGPLRTLVRSRERRVLRGIGLRDGRWRFGTWLAIEDAPLATVTAFHDLVDPHLRDWLATAARGAPFVARQRGFAGPPHDELYVHLQIPGLGRVPVRLFFVLILGFAVLVGPVNYVMLRRRRRLMWLLVTVPAAGLVMTGVILGYGILGEGFGAKGVIRSLTVLDQRVHESVTCAGRTLYAGLSPDGLSPAPDTHLFCVDLAAGTWHGRASQGVHALDVDLDRGGRLDGAVLPSRTPTAFFSCTQGRQRERLRFRRLPSGEYQMLAGPGLQPAPGARTVLLRDFEGRWFTNRADGRMVPADDRAEVYRAIAMPFLGMLADQHAPVSYLLRHVRGEYPLGAWFTAVAGENLPPGAYLARVTSFAGVDTLGLEPEYLDHAHVVKGLLAREDIVE